MAGKMSIPFPIEIGDKAVRLTSLDATGKTDGHILTVQADGTVDAEGVSLALNDITDVTITSATSGESLKYNGSAWVNGTLDGSDVGLADAPGSDGDYVLRRVSGVKSWAAAAGGGGASWTAGTTEGLKTLNTSGVVLATWDLPSGWMANGASADLVADLLVISNASIRSLDFRWQFRDVSNASVFYITQSGSTGTAATGAGTPIQCKLNIYIPDVTSGIFFRTASRASLAVTAATSTGYLEAFTSLATATKIVLLGEQDSGSDTTVTCFRLAGMDTTP